jgi:N-methylhydantoinase B
MDIKTKEKGATVDPITLSVVWNRLLTITRECGERVVHSAQSFVMGNARDLGPVILTPDSEIVTSVEFLICHCLLAEIPTKAILNKFGKLDPGDMVVANDAFIIQSGHLPDWTWLMPIYYKNELVYYLHFRGHVMDSGGALSGSYFPRAYDCIAEGLNIPPVKIMKRGVPNEEVREVIYDNIRTPAGVWADQELIYGSIMRLQDDVCNIIERYGLDTLQACTREMIRRDELATRQQIKEIPDGVYYGESASDWDGTTPDKQVWIRVKLTVKGDEMTFDLSESDDEVDFINSPLGNTYAYIYNAIFLVLDASIPHNHGARIPVNIICREGSVVYPTRPHTYGACACSVGPMAYEACAMALAKALPELAQAPASRHFCVDYAGRLPLTDPRTGHDLEFFGAPFIEEGGSGAVKGYDGWDGVVGSCLMGVAKRGSVEENELAFPFRWDTVEIDPDSEGAGEYRGSRGTYSKRYCTMPKEGRMMLMSGDCDGATYPPHGVVGAPPAPVGEIYMIRAGKKKWEIFKTLDMGPMFAGDLLITKAMGGGGWGNPFDRDPEKIRLEVRDGLLTPQRARHAYGVVITQKNKNNPETVGVDYKATEALRKQLRDKSVYRDMEAVAEDVRAGKISVAKAKSTYGVVMIHPWHAPEKLLIDYKATQELRKTIQTEETNKVKSSL